LKIPLSLLTDLNLLKDYITDIDFDVQDNIVIVYITCTDSQVAKRLVELANELRKKYLGGSYE
jgi:siroheme synthase (precorrin-2 oxidase/ferrochelatase)